MKAIRWALLGSVVLWLSKTATVARPVGGELAQRAAWSVTQRQMPVGRRDEAHAWGLQGVPAGLHVPLDEQERALIADASDGVFDSHSLLVAGLIASGATEPMVLDRYVERFSELAERLRRRVPTDADERTKAARTLRFLHGEVLRGRYGREVTTLTAALERGNYNCVSSAVLFNCLARAVGLCVQGVQVPGHAFSVVRTAGENEIVVQTTCASWLDQSVETRPLPVGADSGDGPRRLLSDPQLVAMIYFNRGVTAIRGHQYEEAVAQNFKALWLDRQFDKARHNLLATLDRWEADYCQQERYGDAIRVLGYALWIAPAHETLHAKYENLCRDYATRLLEQQRYDEALAVLAEADARLKHEPWINRLRRAALEGQGTHGGPSTASARSNMPTPRRWQHNRAS